MDKFQFEIRIQNVCKSNSKLNFKTKVRKFELVWPKTVSTAGYMYFIRLQLGVVMLERGQHKEALYKFEDALRCDPNHRVRLSASSTFLCGFWNLCICFYDVPLWNRNRIGLLNKFCSCRTKCAKMYLRFTKYYSVTNMLLLTGMPSFDTISCVIWAR